LTTSARGSLAWNLGIGAILAILALVLLYSVVPKRAKGPNILLIVADTLRADHLGCFGFEKDTSPRIDGLASRGTRFTRYYTVVPTTLASFTSLLTSRHPKDHGAFRNGFKGYEDLPVLSRVFQDAGYETAAFVSSYCLGREFGMSRGFDLFDQQFTTPTRLPDNRLIRPASEVTRSVLNWLRGDREDAPFFALVHYFDPHWPQNPPPAFREFFGAVKQADPNGLPSFKAAQRHLEETGGRPGAFEINLHNLYCAEIRYMDSEIGKVLDYLDEAGLAEDTVVVFTADHGRTFWDHDDYFNHGRFVYESTIHIPLILRAGGKASQEVRCDELLCNLDLGPTLCDLAGLEAPAGFEGRSFASLVEPGSAARGDGPPLFSEATMPYEAEIGAARPNLLKAKCVRQGPWKYVTYPFYPERKDQLFNVEADPLETRDMLTGEEGPLASRGREMKERLDRWANRYRPRPDDAPAMDEETRRRMEEMGY
jgi:arylsulfatase A-like enzyme